MPPHWFLPPAPAAGGGAQDGAPVLTVHVRKAREGLYRLTTGPGSYDSLIVEFRDPLMMLEADSPRRVGLALHRRSQGTHPQQADSLRDEQHPHSDHTGGCRRSWRRRNVITQKNNEEFFERAEHATGAAERKNLARIREDKDRRRVREKVYSDGNAERWRCTTRSGSSLERDDGGVHPEGEASCSRVTSHMRLTASRRTTRLCPRSGPREAQAGLRSLYQRALLRDATDQGRFLEAVEIRKKTVGK